MVLYINGNYPHHSLHSELVSKLAEMGHEITVFVPMKGKTLDGKYDCKHPGVKILYSDCLKTSDRLLFMSKIHRIIRQIEKEIEVNKIDCILAGTVYSDGAVAYLLHQKYGIPFSVAVRETDITYQMKWRPYLNRFIKQLLRETYRVIFLSPAYKSYLNKFGCDQSKYVIMPNAINDFWFQNQKEGRNLHKTVSCIFVGELSKRKNVGTIISVIAELQTRNIPAELHIVGSGTEEAACQNLAKALHVSESIHFHGWQNGKEKIKTYYDQADIFIMLSHRETFGTVYIEALSQGLPIIYTKGQGIDGYFAEGIVGYGCDPTNVHEITDKIVSILNHYNDISKQCIQQSIRFKWEKVAKQYHDVICDMRKQ